eukprot:8409041-Karenia_brevis.AAC.1
MGSLGIFIILVLRYVIVHACMCNNDDWPAWPNNGLQMLCQLVGLPEGWQQCEIPVSLCNGT